MALSFSKPLSALQLLNVVIVKTDQAQSHWRKLPYSTTNI